MIPSVDLAYLVVYLSFTVLLRLSTYHTGTDHQTSPTRVKCEQGRIHNCRGESDIFHRVKPVVPVGWLPVGPSGIVRRH